MFVFNKEVPMQQAGEGVQRKVLAADGALMAVEVHFEKDAVGAIHQHPHEQISYVLSGSFIYEIDGVKRTIVVGDSCYVAANQRHGVTALEKGVLLDLFTPQREDFK